MVQARRDMSLLSIDPAGAVWFLFKKPFGFLTPTFWVDMRRRNNVQVPSNQQKVAINTINNQNPVASL